MRIPYEIILAFVIGIVVIALLGYLLLVPRRFMWRIAAGAVFGAIALWVINIFSAITGFFVAINPFTALTTGLLGLPGALLVVILSYYLL